MPHLGFVNFRLFRLRKMKPSGEAVIVVAILATCLLLRGLDMERLLAINLALAEKPGLQAVEIEIDNRRRIEGEHLAEREAADHRIAERLAQLRACARAKHQWQAREHGGGGRHHDRAEP